MPIAVADLRGLPFYSLAFSAYLTLSLLGMVLAGQRADARGPRLPFLAGTGLFGAGLVLAGTASSMGQFVAGRAVQGLGGGMVIVSLYVLVARALPDHLGAARRGRPVRLRVPRRARLVAVGLPRRRRAHGVPARFPGQAAAHAADLRSTCAALTALGVGLFQTGAQEPNWIGAVLVPLALVLLVPTAPRLLPRGIFRAGRGLPTVIALRGLMAGAYFGIEAFVPLMLVQERGCRRALAHRRRDQPAHPGVDRRGRHVRRLWYGPGLPEHQRADPGAVRPGRPARSPSLSPVRSIMHPILRPSTTGMCSR